MTARSRSAILALCFVLTLPGATPAQIRASELGSVSQTVDGTRIVIEYSRPRTRGRNALFGTPAAHWGETWTPGANWATTLEVSKDVTLNNQRVPKGKYSVWMILREQGDWTTVLDSNFHRFHMDPPDSTVTAIRIPTHIDQAPLVDVLTWSFPELRIDGGALAMQWGTTRATLALKVSPSLTVALAEAEARPYLGRYLGTWTAESDSGKPLALNVTYEHGVMKGEFDPADPYLGKFALIRVAPDVFVPGLYDKQGEIYEVLRPDMVATFTRVNGRPMSVAWRDAEDVLFAVGKRPN
ncbi:MAG: DUF2911 domain-containing protein [Gemmatimonadota bacterium]